MGFRSLHGGARDILRTLPPHHNRLCFRQRLRSGVGPAGAFHQLRHDGACGRVYRSHNKACRHYAVALDGDSAGAYSRNVVTTLHKHNARGDSNLHRQQPRRTVGGYNHRCSMLGNHRATAGCSLFCGTNR